MSISIYQYQSQIKKAEEIFNIALQDNKRLVKKVNKLNAHIVNLEREIDKMEKNKYLMSYDIDKERDNYLCQLCIDKPRDTVLLPCRHFFCSKCVDKLEYPSCPNCRSNIEGLLEVII